MGGAGFRETLSVIGLINLVSEEISEICFDGPFRGLIDLLVLSLERETVVSREELSIGWTCDAELPFLACRVDDRSIQSGSLVGENGFDGL